jgi:CubicO group peptidase (beta-lactamase class C family)
MERMMAQKFTQNGPGPRRISRRQFVKLAAAAGLLSGCGVGQTPAAAPTPVAQTAAAGAQPPPGTPTPIPPAPATNPPAPRADYFPAGMWRTSTPEEQGIDSQGIAAMIDKIAQASPYVHSFLLIRNGTLVAEAYFAPIAREHIHLLFSATKSVTSALVGIAIQEGLIKGVDQKVLDFFPELKAKNLNKRVGDLTIGHLLTMTTGHADAVSPNPYQPAPVDWVEKFLDNPANPVIDEPGTQFLYTSGGPHTLSAILQKVSGKPAADYAAEKLFGPLGIPEYAWLADQNGITFGNSWLRLRPLDMAKFGYLYLNNGDWNGQQVVPQAWVEQSTRKAVETKGTMFNNAEQDGYGYLWWMNSFGGYAAHGYGGQFIFVVPASALVAVFTSGFADSMFDTAYELMKTYIIPAVKPNRPLAKNDAAYQALAARVKQVGTQTPKPVAPLPEMARQVSGKTYNMQDGNRLTAYFDAATEYTLKIEPLGMYKGEEHVLELRGGLDDVYRLNQSIDGTYGPYIVGCKGTWQDERTFVHIDYPTDNISRIIVKATFEKDGLTIEPSEEISGTSTPLGTIAGTLEE